MSIDPGELAAHFAAQLEEPNVELIRRIVEQIGEENTRAMFEETQIIEAAGGQLIKSGKRRRTPGGVFFYLARQRLTKEQKDIVFAELSWRRVWMGPGDPPYRQSTKLRTPKKQPPIVAEGWDVVRNVVKALLKEKQSGKATAVNIQLTGRPGKVAVRKNFVVTTLETDAEPPELSPGMPTPPKTRLMYLVYISRTEWDPISQQLQSHPDDEMQVDGFLTYDSELKKLSIFATKASTRLLEERTAKTTTDAEAGNVAETE